MASFRCYDNPDVIIALIITNFHLDLKQLWWQCNSESLLTVTLFMLKQREGIDPKENHRATLNGILNRY